MPVDFLSDVVVARYGRYDDPPTRAELETVFFLDDEDKALIGRHRRLGVRLGFALQLVTVRYLGCFLSDPLDVPTEVLDTVARQLGIADVSCVKEYAQREKTRLDHAWEIQERFELTDFASHAGELTVKVAARAWNSGDGPTALFHFSVRWLRENDVLLPGITTLTRLVARVREESTQRLWNTVYELTTPPQRTALDEMLDVPTGRRVSQLERWRTGPSKASGPGLIKALELVSEIVTSGLGGIDLDAAIPPRRAAELARYGLAARAAQLKKHPPARRVATLVATMQRLQTKTIDDALELLDLLMVTELLGRAHRDADKQTLRRQPKLAKASARLALAVEVLLEASQWGEEVRLFEVWEMIDAVVPRAELRSAVSTVTGMVPPPDALDDGGWRASMASHYPTVSGFLRLLTAVIEFGANTEGEPVLAAMRALPQAMAHRSRTHSATALPLRLIDTSVVTGVWKRLVFGHPPRTDGLVDRNAYVFCVLEQFHRHLKRREIFAPASSRWRDPNAQLVDGPAWEAMKHSVLTDLGLPEVPDGLLAGHCTALDRTYRIVSARLPANTAASVDDDGRIHVASVKAIPD